MSWLTTASLLAMLTLPIQAFAFVDCRAQGALRESRSELSASDSLATQLDLRVPPPHTAYAITGDYLPPFLQAVLVAWNREFPKTPLSANSIIFVIHPDNFYSDLDANQRDWLATREMLGLRNFPIIINPLTPGDDWYLRAQKEWQSGNEDAIYALLASLYHEVVHTQLSGDERQAYKTALDLFGRFHKQGKLRSSYGRSCYALLRNRYADLLRHPDQYVQVRVRFQQQTVALLIRSTDASRPH